MQVQQVQPQADVDQLAPTPTEELQKRPKSKDVVLGDQVIIVSRLGTRDGLAVAQQLLRYIDRLRDPILEATKQGDLTNLDSDETMAVASNMLSALTEVLEDDALLRLLCRLLGQPPEVVGAAPIEDTINALTAALSVNDMPALLRAARGLWQEVQRMGAKL